MSFAFPYQARIMLRYGDGAAIELHRFSRPIMQADLNHWSADRETGTEIFVEELTPARLLISPRPIPESIAYICDRKAQVSHAELAKLDLPWTPAV